MSQGVWQYYSKFTINIILNNIYKILFNID